MSRGSTDGPMQPTRNREIAGSNPARGTDSLQTSERLTEFGFKNAEPLERDGSVVAEIEDNAMYASHFGKVWTDTGWYTLEQARALRDWLNKVIP